MENVKFRTLRADEIEVRVGDKRNGKMSLLLYQDARCAMNILDETLGQFGWACQFKEEKGTLFAGIAIKDANDTWIWKWDAGAPSNFEREKGEASDAFKRAAVRWGLGRELYTAPKVRVPDSDSYHKVTHIAYDSNRRIKDLTIEDWNGNVVFNMIDGRIVPYHEPEIDREELLRIFCSEQKEAGADKKELLAFYKYYSSRAEDFDKWSEGVIRSLWKKWNTPKG